MRRQSADTNRTYNFMAAIIILILTISLCACVLYIKNGLKDEKEHTASSEETEKLKQAEREIDSLRTEKNNAEDSARQYKSQLDTLRKENGQLKKSEREAVIARSRAENEAESLRSEKESAEDTAKRYRNQLDALRKENEKLKSEVARLTKKLDNSLVRIANPFKH